MRIKIKVSYDGSNFYGFQRLNEKRTVQKELERVVSILNKKDTLIKGASRTDKGVHAYGQVAHFDLEAPIELKKLKNIMNGMLPKDIHILEVEQVSDDFHARFSVKNKKYVYKINLGDYDVLKSNYYLQYPYLLDIKKMKKCSKIFLGIHDFKNFVSGELESTISCVDKINFKRKKDILEIEFIGKSFYRYMVRNMVGAMLDVGRGKKSIEVVEDMLFDLEHQKETQTADACGLYLMEIWY